MKKLLKHVSAFAGETFAFLRVMWLYPFYETKLDALRPGKNVVCVHGLMHNGSAWGSLRKHLHEEGLGPIDTVFYPSLFIDIPNSSLRVRDKVEEIKTQTGRDVDILIGHSEGGLVALEYALAHAPKNRITTVITLGAPLQGTQLAKMGLGPGAKQMRLGSEYTKNLRERMGNATHVRLYAIASSVDRVVRPASASFWPEHPHKVFDDLGHVQLLFSRNVAREVLHAIHGVQS